MGVRFVGRGVGFRPSAVISPAVSVTGTVRNEADGSVWLEAQGSEEAVGVFIDSILERMGRLVQSTSSRASRRLRAKRSFRSAGEGGLWAA